ncbi:hypothetical protein GE09DRAFT_966402 [Coniochaeta sp. 2T2.1]|nr:hypothetical protein GE09DRAFT_966402 [Coniochaeta sp. 2T2.1]
MGASKVLSVLLRLWELACSAIVLGVVGGFFSRVNQANSYADNRLVYTIVIASISTAVSLLFMMPFTFTFMACPLDFILFALWLVAFILLEVLTGSHTCNASWYYNYYQRAAMSAHSKAAKKQPNNQTAARSRRVIGRRRRPAKTSMELPCSTVQHIEVLQQSPLRQRPPHLLHSSPAGSHHDHDQMQDRGIVN